MAGNDEAAGGGGAAEVDVESNSNGGARDNPNPPRTRTGRTTIRNVALSGDLSPEEKLEAMKRKYNPSGDGTFQEQAVNNIFTHLFSEVQSSEDLKQKNSYLGKKLAKNRKHSLAAIVGMGIVTIAASTAGLVAVNKSVNSSEEKVQGAIVESAFAEAQVDDAGVAHLTDKAGRDLTTRATGDVFHATIVHDPRTGRKLTCVRVLEAAGMAGSVASGADTRLAVVDESSGLEKKVLSLAGDFKDSGDALHFGGEKVQVHLDDDSCNVALQANSMALPPEEMADAVEEDSTIPPEDVVHGPVIETSYVDNTTTVAEEYDGITLQTNAPDKGEDEAPPNEDVVNGPVDETSYVDNTTVAEEDGGITLQTNAPDKAEDEALEDSNIALQDVIATDKLQNEALTLEDGVNDAVDETGATKEDVNTSPFGRLRSLIAPRSAGVHRDFKSPAEDDGVRVQGILEVAPVKDAMSQFEGEDVLARHRKIYSAARAAHNQAGSVAFEAGQRFLQDDAYGTVTGSCDKCTGADSCRMISLTGATRPMSNLHKSRIGCGSCLADGACTVHISSRSDFSIGRNSCNARHSCRYLGVTNENTDPSPWDAPVSLTRDIPENSCNASYRCRFGQVVCTKCQGTNTCKYIYPYNGELQYRDMHATHKSRIACGSCNADDACHVRSRVEIYIGANSCNRRWSCQIVGMYRGLWGLYWDRPPNEPVTSIPAGECNGTYEWCKYGVYWA